MEVDNGELVVTVRAKSMPDLRRKLLAILGEEETKPEPESDTTESAADFPDAIKSILPDYADRTHGAAMLTVLHEKHKGKENSVDSSKLAEEMVDRFPRLFRGYTVGKVSSGNVFAGNGLKSKNLIQFENHEDSDDQYRLYWVEP